MVSRTVLLQSCCARLSAFEDRYEELREAFKPLEEEYNRTNGQLRQKIILYTARHAEHF